MFCDTTLMWLRQLDKYSAPGFHKLQDAAWKGRYPLDGRMQQAQLLARGRVRTELAGAHAEHARQEAVHAVHAARVPHLNATE